MDISHIVTVYNKEKYLADTVASLLRQTGGFTREFIFVDDCSKDSSLQVIENACAGVSHVTIIRNTQNAGPSIRLNQGAAAARGKYLHFLDSDDLVPRGAIAHLYEIAQQERADMVYGGWRRTKLSGAEFLAQESAQPQPDAITHRHHADALYAVLKGNFTRMCWLVEREIFAQSGGCDERVFIQDQSLPLRLARAGKTLVTTDMVVNVVPRSENNLSANLSQLNHDRFFAFYNFLRDNPAVSVPSQRLLAKRSISAAWKERTRENTITPYLTLFFWQYARSKHLLPMPDMRLLESLREYFAGVVNIRRITP